eukprot:CAMPEP_0181174282 /NCGR_PEP_ID=MMETSP1096-20121128/3450_1 /TAXON_ID=156174 ORGANISM="Chrysochromulina ericina, Strain CCMP281" /NCGR_SAMPLE_ID=MMETSP1096 /ASSEMBLY_ACC=CAM_ASM_000453 /LENGTH=50 /DNA_ID=CAMNT_0023262167 /DNA_START=152 /DNA_END=301 /DNA_ORIENTATION=-
MRRVVADGSRWYQVEAGGGEQHGGKVGPGEGIQELLPVASAECISMTGAW